MKKGTAVHYSFLACMRDPSKFPDPDTFRPSRWREEAKPRLDHRDMLGFGLGPHACVGRGFSWDTMKVMAQFVMRRFRLENTNKSFFPKVKFLPCLRPVEPTLFEVKLRNLDPGD